MSVVGGLLAGGRSTRMGRSKAGMGLPDGRSFSQAVLQALGEVTEEVVVLGHGKGVFPLEGLTRLPDALPGEGPLGGITTLLESGRGQRYLIAACDSPLVDAPLLKRLLQAGPTAIFQGTPLPLLLGAEAAAPLRAYLATGARQLGPFVDSLSPHRLSVTATEEHRLSNFNSPADLAVLEELD